MTLVSVRVASANANHSDTDDGGSPGYTEDPNLMGFLSPRNLHVGWLLLDVDITGVVIDALIRVKDQDFGSGGQISGLVSLDDNSATPGSFSSGDSSADRPHSTFTVLWQYTASGGEIEDSTDFAEGVNELRTSFGDLTNLGVFYINDDTGSFHDIENFTTDSANAALLVLNFTDASIGVDEILAALAHPGFQPLPAGGAMIGI